MILVEFLRAAIENLRGNPMRSGLTMLGVVIGVASVITLVSLGLSTRAQIDAQIRALGSNQLLVIPGSVSSAGVQQPGRMRFGLRDTDASLLVQEIPEITVAAATISARVQVVRGSRNWPTTLQAADADYLPAREWRLADGRAPTLDEERRGARVAVLGSTVANALFGAENPLGRTVRINRASMLIIGVLAVRGGGAATQDQNDLVLTPLSTARMRLVGRRPAVTGSVDLIVVNVADGTDIAQTKAQIIAALRQRHRVGPAVTEPFRVLSMAEQLETRLEAATRLNQLLIAVASVSLLVGGVGIMNMMLVSVTERTREIGLRRAVGASRKDIVGQILVEAATLATFGGAVGLLIAIAASTGLSTVAELPVVIDTRIMALSLVFSAAVGILFGYYPARKAAAREPMDALRYE